MKTCPTRAPGCRGEALPLPCVFHCLRGSDTACALSFHCLRDSGTAFALCVPLPSVTKRLHACPCGLAGASTSRVRQRRTSALCRTWDSTPCSLTSTARTTCLPRRVSWIGRRRPSCRRVAWPNSDQCCHSLSHTALASKGVRSCIAATRPHRACDPLLTAAAPPVEGAHSGQPVEGGLQLPRLFEEGLQLPVPVCCCAWSTSGVLCTQRLPERPAVQPAARCVQLLPREAVLHVH